MRTLLGLCAALLFVAGHAEARCLRFEPANVTLTGTITERLVPGPPRYQSIARGDLPEKVLFLALEKPLCVSGDPMKLRNTLTIAGVEEVHVRIDRFWRRSLLGQRVDVTGSLFTSHSPAHRTRVVITAVGILPTRN